MVTKEECENALYELSLITAKDTEDGSCLGCSCTSCLPNDECENGKLIGVFNRLIDEHYDNLPLKFEELRVGEWVFDKLYNDFFLICTKSINDDSTKILGNEHCYRTFEENRFYRKQVEE